MVSAKDENKTPPRKGGTEASASPNGGANVGEALRAVYRDAGLAWVD